LARTTGCEPLDLFRQTSIVGGSSVTEQAALTVMPANPWGPSVVTTLTAAERFAIAARNARRDSVSSSSSGTDSSGEEEMPEVIQPDMPAGICTFSGPTEGFP
jgi:hypothetical protein